MKVSFSIKGAHYRHWYVYKFITLLKLGRTYDERYKIAAKCIGNSGSVLDVCSGVGELKRYLPKDCHYRCIDASPQFSSVLSHKGVENYCLNLHDGISIDERKVDAVVMIISLTHFRHTSVHELLEAFKKMAKKVIIVEDVLFKEGGRNSFVQKAISYLCHTQYFVPAELYTIREFKELMFQHGYACIDHWPKYWVGYYDQNDDLKKDVS